MRSSPGVPQVVTTPCAAARSCAGRSGAWADAGPRSWQRIAGDVPGLETKRTFILGLSTVVGSMARGPKTCK